MCHEVLSDCHEVVKELGVRSQLWSSRGITLATRKVVGEGVFSRTEVIRLIMHQHEK